MFPEKTLNVANMGFWNRARGAPRVKSEIRESLANAEKQLSMELSREEKGQVVQEKAIFMESSNSWKNQGQR